MNFNIKDTFNQELPADPLSGPARRQVEGACFSYIFPKETAHPVLIHTSPEMAGELGLTPEDVNSEEFLNVFTGNAVHPNTRPYAMCYGGHQFGNWAGQLGDGRAINLFEADHNGKKWALQLKGAGDTPYSRTADGLAVLRSSIREYLCSEAMYHLGVPTTRALSLALTGDQVLRDVLYNGNPAYEKGAVICRTAASFIRFGSFEIFAAREDIRTLRILTDYTIKHFYPHLETGTKEGYVQFFKEVAERTLDMIIHWQAVGFVHGVMNTDNMSVLGLTMDYGPYGWLEGYDPGWTPNTTDRQFKRYRYGNQINIGHWNLYQLANALFPLIQETDPLENILKAYSDGYQEKYPLMMKSKTGLFKNHDTEGDLITRLEETLQLTETDMTIFFRKLSDFKKTTKMDSSFLDPVMDAFYAPGELKGAVLDQWKKWFLDYRALLQEEELSDEQRKTRMNKVNPKYVLRNYMAQLAIEAADKGDYDLIDELFSLLKKPYQEQEDSEKWFAKRPEWARNKVGCSMLSCSS